MKRTFEVKQIALFTVSKMPSFRLIKENCKNISDKRKLQKYIGHNL